MLVGSVLLYGVEEWGCGRQIGPVVNVQMRAVRIFMEVGRLRRQVVEGGHEGSYEVGKQSEMGERFEDGFRRIWVARIGHAGI